VDEVIDAATAGRVLRVLQRPGWVPVEGGVPLVETIQLRPLLLSCGSGEYLVALPQRHKSVEVPALPRKWIRVPNGTPPQLEQFVDNPVGLKEYVQDVLRSVQQYQEAQVELIEVFFEVGRPVAHVLVKDLDDPVSVKAVCRALGAEGFTELLTAEQFELAIRREPGSASSTS
jgi:hypothetical protein